MTISKIANVGIPKNPSPLELANVANLDPASPSPLKTADVLEFVTPTTVTCRNDIFALFTH